MLRPLVMQLRVPRSLLFLGKEPAVGEEQMVNLSWTLSPRLVQSPNVSRHGSRASSRLAYRDLIRKSRELNTIKERNVSVESHVLIQGAQQTVKDLFLHEKLQPAFISQSSFRLIPVFIQKLNILTNRADCIISERIFTLEGVFYRNSTITVPLSLLILNSYNTTPVQPPQILTYMLPEFVNFAADPCIADIRRIKGDEFVGELLIRNSYLANPLYTMLLDLIHFTIYYLSQLNALTKEFANRYHVSKEAIKPFSPLDTRTLKTTKDTYVVESNLVDLLEYQKAFKFNTIHTEELESNSILPLSLPMRYDIIIPTSYVRTLPEGFQKLLTDCQWDYKHALLNVLYRQCAISKSPLGTLSFSYKESEAEHTILKRRVTSPITLESRYDAPIFHFYVRNASKGFSYLRFFRDTKAELYGIITYTERYGPRQTLAMDKRLYEANLKRLGFPVMTVLYVYQHLFSHNSFLVNDKAFYGTQLQTSNESVPSLLNPNTTNNSYTSILSEYGLFGVQRPTTSNNLHTAPSLLEQDKNPILLTEQADLDGDFQEKLCGDNVPDFNSFENYKSAFDSPKLLSSPRFYSPYALLQVEFLKFICSFIDVVSLSISAVKSGKDSVGVILQAFNTLFISLHTRYSEVGYSFITVKKRIFFLLRSFSTETFSLLDYYTHHYHLEKGISKSILNFLMNPSIKRALQRESLPNVHAYIHLYMTKEIHLEAPNKYHRLDKISDDDDASETEGLFMQMYERAGKKNLINCYLGDPGDFLDDTNKLKPLDDDEDDDEDDNKNPEYICSGKVLKLEKIELDEATPMLHFATLYIRLFGVFIRELVPIICTLFARDCVLNQIHHKNNILRQNPILCYKLFCRVVISKLQETYLDDINDWKEYIGPRSQHLQQEAATEPITSQPSSKANFPRLNLDLDLSSLQNKAGETDRGMSSAAAVTESIITRRFLSQGFFTTPDNQEMDFLHFEFNSQQISKDAKRYVVGEDLEGLSNIRVIYGNSLDFELSQFRVLIAAIFTAVSELKCNIEQHLDFDLIFLSRSIVSGFDTMPSLQVYVQEQTQHELSLIQQSLTDYNILTPKTFRDDIKRVEYLTEISTSRCPDFVINYYAMRRNMRRQYSSYLLQNIKNLNKVKEVYGLSMTVLNEAIHTRSHFDRSIILPEMQTFISFEKLLSSISSVSQLCFAFFEQEFSTNTLHLSAKNLIFSLCFDPHQEADSVESFLGTSSSRQVIRAIYPPKFLFHVKDTKQIPLDFQSLLGLDTTTDQSFMPKGEFREQTIGNMSLPLKMTRSSNTQQTTDLEKVSSLKNFLEISKALELIENAISVTQDIASYIKDHLLPLPDVLYTRFATYTIKILKNTAINKLISLMRQIRYHVRETIYSVIQEASKRIMRFKESLVIDIDTPEDLEMVLQSKEASKQVLHIWKPTLSIIFLALPRLAYLESYRHIVNIQNLNEDLNCNRDATNSSAPRRPVDIYTLLESEVSFDQKMDHIFDAQFWKRCKQDIEVYEAAKQQEAQRHLEEQQSIIRHQEEERRELIKKIAQFDTDLELNDKSSLHHTYVSEKALNNMKQLPLNRKYLNSKVRNRNIKMQPTLRKKSALVTYRQDLLTLDTLDFNFNIIEFFKQLTSITTLMKRANQNIQLKIRPFSRYIYLSVEYLMYLRTVCTNYAVEVCYMTESDLILAIRDPTKFHIKYPYITSNLKLEKIDKYFLKEDIDVSYMFLNFLQKSTSLAITKYANERSIALSTCYLRPNESDLNGIEAVETFDDLLAFLIQQISTQVTVRGYVTVNKNATNKDTYYNIYYMLSDVNYIASESQKIYNSLQKWATLVGIELSIVRPTFDELATSLKHPIKFFTSLINIYSNYIQSLNHSISLFSYDLLETYTEELYLATREMHLSNKHRLKCAQQKSEGRNVKASSFFTKAIQSNALSTQQADKKSICDFSSSIVKSDLALTKSAHNVDNYTDVALVLDGSTATSLPMFDKLQSHASDTLLTLLTSHSRSTTQVATSAVRQPASVAASKLREFHHELPEPGADSKSPSVCMDAITSSTDQRDDSESDIVTIIPQERVANESTMPSKLLIMQVANEMDLDSVTTSSSHQELVHDNADRSSDKEEDEDSSDFSNDDEPIEQLNIALLRRKQQQPVGFTTSQSNANFRLIKAVNERIRASAPYAEPVAAKKLLQNAIVDQLSPSSSEVVSAEPHLTDENFVLEYSSSTSINIQPVESKQPLKSKPKLFIVTNAEEQAEIPTDNAYLDPDFLTYNIQQIIKNYCKKHEQPPFTVQYSSWIDIADKVVQVHMLAITQRILFLSKIRRLFTSRCFVERLFTMLDKSVGDVNTSSVRNLLRNTTVQDLTSMLSSHNFELVKNLIKIYETNLEIETKLYTIYQWILSLKVWIVRYELEIPLHPLLKEILFTQGNRSRARLISRKKHLASTASRLCRSRSGTIDDTSPATYNPISRVCQMHKPVTMSDLDCSLYCPITLDYSTKYKKKYVNMHRPTQVLLFDRLEPLVDLLREQSLDYSIVYQKMLTSDVSNADPEDITLKSGHIVSDDEPSDELHSPTTKLGSNTDSPLKCLLSEKQSVKKSYDSQEFIEIEYLALQPYLLKALREALFVVSDILSNDYIIDSLHVTARRLHLLLIEIKGFVLNVEKLKLILPEALALLAAMFDNVVDLRLLCLDFSDYKQIVRTILQSLHLFSSICTAIHDPDKKVDYGVFSPPSLDHLKEVSVVKNKRLDIPRLEFVSFLSDLADNSAGFSIQMRQARLATYLDGDGTCMPLAFLFEHQQYTLTEAFVAAIDKCDSFLQNARQQFRKKNLAYIVSGTIDTSIMHLPESFFLLFGKFNGAFITQQICNQFFGATHTGSELFHPLSKHTIANLSDTLQYSHKDFQPKTVRVRGGCKSTRFLLPTHAATTTLQNLNYSYSSGHIITNRLLYSKSGSQISFFGIQSGHEAILYNEVISLKSRFKLASLLFHPQLVAPAMQAEFRKALILLLNEQYYQLLCYCPYQAIIHAISACILIYTDGRYEPFEYCYYIILDRIKRLIERFYREIISQMGNTSAELFNEASDSNVVVTKIFTLRAVYARILELQNLLEIIAISVISYIFAVNKTYAAKFPKLERPFYIHNYSRLLRKFSKTTILSEQSLKQGVSLSFMYNKFTSSLFLTVPVLNLIQQNLSQHANLKGTQKVIITAAYKKAITILKRSAPLRSQVDSQQMIQANQLTPILSPMVMSEKIGDNKVQSQAKGQAIFTSTSSGVDTKDSSTLPEFGLNKDQQTLHEEDILSIDPLPRLIPNVIISIDADSDAEIVIPLDDPAQFTIPLLGSYALHEIPSIYAHCCTQYDTVFIDYQHNRVCSLLFNSLSRNVPVFIFTDKYMGYRSVELFYVMEYMMRFFSIRYRFINLAPGKLSDYHSIIYSYLLSGITVILVGLELLSLEDRMDLALFLIQPSSLYSGNSLTIYDPITGDTIDTNAVSKASSIQRFGGIIFWIADAVAPDQAENNYSVTDWAFNFLRLFTQRAQIYLPISYISNDCHALAMDYTIDMPTYMQRLTFIKNELSASIFELIDQNTTKVHHVSTKVVSSLVGSIIASRIGTNRTSFATNRYLPKMLDELQLVSDQYISCTPHTLLNVIPQYAEQISYFVNFLLRQNDCFPKLILKDIRVITQITKSPITGLNICLSFLFYLLPMMELKDEESSTLSPRRNYLLTYLETLFNLSDTEKKAFRSFAELPFKNFDNVLQNYATDTYISQLNMLVQNLALLSLFGSHTLYIVGRIILSNRPCILFSDNLDPNAFLRIKTGVESVTHLHLVLVYSIYDLIELTEAMERSAEELALMLICVNPEDTYWIGTIFSMCSYRQEICFPNNLTYVFPRFCKVIVVAHPKCQKLKLISCPNIYFNRNIHLSPLGLLQLSLSMVIFLNLRYLHSIRDINTDNISTYKDIVEYIAMKYDIDYHLYTNSEQTRLKQNVYLNYFNFFYYNIIILASRKVFNKHVFSIRDWRVIKALITLFLSYYGVVNIKHYMDITNKEDYQPFMSSHQKDQAQDSLRKSMDSREYSTFEQITKTIEQPLLPICVSDLNPYAELSYFSHYDQNNIKSSKNEIEYNKECRKEIEFTASQALAPRYLMNTFLYLPSNTGFNRHTQFVYEFSYSFTKLMLVNTNSAEIVKKIHSTIFTAIYNAFSLFNAVNYQSNAFSQDILGHQMYYKAYIEILPTFLHIVQRFFCSTYNFHLNVPMQQWFHSFYESVRSSLQDIYATHLSQQSIMNYIAKSPFINLIDPIYLSDDTVLHIAKLLQLDSRQSGRFESYVQKFNADYLQLNQTHPEHPELQLAVHHNQERLSLSQLEPSSLHQTETSVLSIAVDLQSSDQTDHNSHTSMEPLIKVFATPYSSNILTKQFQNKSYIRELFESTRMNLHQFPFSGHHASQDVLSGVETHIPEDLRLSNLPFSSLINLSSTDSTNQSELLNLSSKQSRDRVSITLEDSTNVLENELASFQSPVEYIDFVRQAFQFLPVPCHLGKDLFTNPVLSSFIQHYSDNDADPPLILTTELCALAICMAGFILANECFVLAGPAFTGKSTLLKLAYTIIPSGLVSLSSFRLSSGNELDLVHLIRKIIQRNTTLKPDTAYPGECYTLSPLERKLLVIHVENVEYDSWKALVRLNLQDGLLSLTPNISQVLEPGLNSTGILFLPSILFVYETVCDKVSLSAWKDEFYFIAQTSTLSTEFMQKFLFWGMIYRRFVIPTDEYANPLSSEANNETDIANYFHNWLLQEYQQKICAGPSSSIQSTYTRVSYLQRFPRIYKESLCKLPVSVSALIERVKIVVQFLKRLESILPISILNLAWSMLQNSACDDGFIPKAINSSRGHVTSEDLCFQLPSINLLLSTLVRHPSISFQTVIQLINRMLGLDMSDSELSLDDLRSSSLSESRQEPNLCLFHESWVQGLDLLLRYPDKPVEDFVTDTSSDSYYVRNKQTLYSSDHMHSIFSDSHVKILLPYFSALGHLVYFKTDLGEHKNKHLIKSVVSESFLSNTHLAGKSVSGFGQTMSRLYIQSTLESERVKTLIPKRLLQKGNMLSRKAFQSSASNLSLAGSFNNDLGDGQRPSTVAAPNRPSFMDSQLFKMHTEDELSDDDNNLSQSFSRDRRALYGDQYGNTIARLLSRCRTITHTDIYAITAVIHLYLAINRAFQSNVIKMAEYLLYLRKGPTRSCPEFTQFTSLSNPPRIPVLSMLLPVRTTSYQLYYHYLDALKVIGQYVMFTSVEFFEFISGNVYSPDDGVLKISIEKKVEAFKIRESNSIEETTDESIYLADQDIAAQKTKKEVSLRSLFQGRVSFVNYKLHLLRYHRFIIDFNQVLQYARASAECIMCVKHGSDPSYKSKDTIENEAAEPSDEDQFISRVDPRVLRKMPLKPVMTPENVEFKRNKEVVKTYSGKLSKTDPFFWIFKEKTEGFTTDTFAYTYDYRHHRHRYFNCLVSLCTKFEDPKKVAHYFLRSMLLMALGFNPRLGFANLSYFKHELYNYKARYICELWPYVDMERIRTDLEISDLAELLLPEPCDIIVTIPLEYLSLNDINSFTDGCPFFSCAELQFISYLISFTYGLQILFSEKEIHWLISRNFALLILEEGEVHAKSGAVKYTAFAPRIHTILLEERLHNLHPCLLTGFSNVSMLLIGPICMSSEMKNLIINPNIQLLLQESRLYSTNLTKLSGSNLATIPEQLLVHIFVKIVNERYNLLITSGDTARVAPGLFLVIEIAWKLLEHRLKTLTSILFACKTILYVLDGLTNGTLLAAKSSLDAIPTLIDTSTANVSIKQSSMASFSTANTRHKTSAMKKRSTKGVTKERQSPIQTLFGSVFSIDPRFIEPKASVLQMINEPKIHITDTFASIKDKYIGLIGEIQRETECQVKQAMELCIEITLLFLLPGGHDPVAFNLFDSSLNISYSQHCMEHTKRRAFSASFADTARLLHSRDSCASESDSYWPARPLSAKTSTKPLNFLGIIEHFPVPRTLMLFFSVLQINLTEVLAIAEILMDSDAKCLHSELCMHNKREYAKQLIIDSKTLTVLATYLLCAQTQSVIPLLPSSYAFVTVLLLEICYRPTLPAEFKMQCKEIDLDIEFHISYINCATTKHSFINQLSALLQDDTNQYGAILFYNCFAQNSQTSQYLKKLIRLLTSTVLLSSDTIIFDASTRIRLKYSLSKCRIYFALASDSSVCPYVLQEIRAYTYKIYTPTTPEKLLVQQFEVLETAKYSSAASMLFINNLYYSMNYFTMYETHPMFSALRLLEAKRALIYEVIVTGVELNDVLVNCKDSLDSLLESVLSGSAKACISKLATLTEWSTRKPYIHREFHHILMKLARAQAALFSYFCSLRHNYQQLSFLFVPEFFTNWSSYIIDKLYRIPTKSEDKVQTHLNWLVHHSIKYPLERVARLLPMTEIEPVLFISSLVYCTAMGIIKAEELAIAKLLITIPCNQFQTLMRVVLNEDADNSNAPFSQYINYTNKQALLLERLSLSKEDCTAAAIASRHSINLPGQTATAWKRLSVLKAFLPQLVDPWLHYFRSNKLSFIKIVSSHSIFHSILGHYLYLEDRKNESAKAVDIEAIFQLGAFGTEPNDTRFNNGLFRLQQLRKKRSTTAPTKNYFRNAYEDIAHMQAMKINQPLPKISANDDSDLQLDKSSNDREVEQTSNKLITEDDDAITKIFKACYVTTNGPVYPRRREYPSDKSHIDTSKDEEDKDNAKHPSYLLLSKAIRQELDGYIKHLELPLDISSFSLRNVWKILLISLVCDRHRITSACRLFLQMSSFCNVLSFVKEYYKRLAEDSIALAKYLGTPDQSLSFNFTTLTRGYLLGFSESQESGDQEPLDTLLKTDHSGSSHAYGNRQGLIIVYEDSLDIELLIRYAYVGVWQKIYPQVTLVFNNYPNEEIVILQNSIIITVIWNFESQMHNLIALKEKLGETIKSNIIICIKSKLSDKLSNSHIERLIELYHARVECLYMPECVFRRYKEYFTGVYAIAATNSNMKRSINTLTEGQSRSLISILLLFSNMDYKTLCVGAMTRQPSSERSIGGAVWRPAFLYPQHLHFNWLVNTIVKAQHGWNALLEFREYLCAYISPEERTFIENTHDDNIEYEKTNRYTLASLINTASQLIFSLTTEMSREIEVGGHGPENIEQPSINFANLPLTCRIARDFSTAATLPISSPLNANYLADILVSPQLMKAFEKCLLEGEFPFVHPRVYNVVDFVEDKECYESQDHQAIGLCNTHSGDDERIFSTNDDNSSKDAHPINKDTDTIPSSLPISRNSFSIDVRTDISEKSVEAQPSRNADQSTCSNSENAHSDIANFSLLLTQRTGTRHPDEIAISSLRFVDNVQFTDSLNVISHAFEKVISIIRKSSRNKEYQLLLSQPGRLTDISTIDEYSKSIDRVPYSLVEALCMEPQKRLFSQQFMLKDDNNYVNDIDNASKVCFRFYLLFKQRGIGKTAHAQQIIREASLLFSGTEDSRHTVMHAKTYGPAMLEVLLLQRIMFANVHSVPLENVRTVLMTEIPNSIKYYYELEGTKLFVHRRQDGMCRYNYSSFCTRIVGLRLYGMMYDSRIESFVDVVASEYGRLTSMDLYAFPICYLPDAQLAITHEANRTSERDADLMPTNFVPVPCVFLPQTHGFLWNKTELTTDDILQRGVYLEVE